MPSDHAGGTHPGGQTSGSPQRFRHQLARPILAFDVEAVENEDRAFLLTIAWPAGGSDAPTVQETARRA
jgi:hypothetical protein